MAFGWRVGQSKMMEIQSRDKSFNKLIYEEEERYRNN
jgi:hypothetical protein